MAKYGISLQGIQSQDRGLRYPAPSPVKFVGELCNTLKYAAKEL
jgi:hypothetical protein